ncbi:branched-chain amino acid transporter AzlD [Pseudoclavibacter chungangensis]|uniref:Branched-chain amino acid transporter AzlD n=1 Tax=Pseudoclavibacter chungangensis TaxID=587635 RepID=A0A7J5BMX7_9MICO|nr:AzlD domain-containing protein [Pseudoclavibacter chungangensis]KAB1652738.1 branched-chain amino acid transporter AzlD [Pseudoclavibacter chungangensis]NYJ68014.1 branched-subunit amino acid transport protein AzlD [Pseudoclavibacter chungangensis]
MLDPWYVAGVLTVGFVITLALRAVPFAILKPLRESRFVTTMATWMPVGILAILAAATFTDTVTTGTGHAAAAVPAAAVTVAVHLLFGRRTLLSVGIGTIVFVLLVNLS